MFTSETMGKPDRQPGRLDYGLFVTFSSSNSGRNHWIRIRGVSRYGDLGTPEDFRWDTSAMPQRMLKDILSVLETTFIEEVVNRYGVEDGLPK